MCKDVTMKKNINYINLNTGEQLDNIWDYLNTDGWMTIPVILTPIPVIVTPPVGFGV